jgi:hypothetical protein
VDAGLRLLASNTLQEVDNRQRMMETLFWESPGTVRSVLVSVFRYGYGDSDDSDTRGPRTNKSETWSRTRGKHMKRGDWRLKPGTRKE